MSVRPVSNHVAAQRNREPRSVSMTKFCANLRERIPASQTISCQEPAVAFLPQFPANQQRPGWLSECSAATDCVAERSQPSENVDSLTRHQAVIPEIPISRRFRCRNHGYIS